MRETLKGNTHFFFSKNSVLVVIMMKIFLIGIVCYFSILSSFAQKNDFYVIDYEHAEEKEILMSDLFEKVEYVQLELTKECPITPYSTTYVTDEYILVVCPNWFWEGGMYLFNRNGHFIKEISGRGQGPNEYLYTMPNYSFYPDKNVIFTDCEKSWRAIDIETEKALFDVVKPMEYYAESGEHQGSINNVYWFDTDRFLGYPNNINGVYPDKLLMFEKTGRVIKKFPNYILEEKERNTSERPYNMGIFYRYKNQLFFKEPFVNDTIFRFNGTNLFPHIVIKTGDKNSIEKTMKVPGETISYREFADGTVLCNRVFEGERYFLFICAVTGEGEGTGTTICCYDKKTNRICRTPFGSYVDAGFVNDIDGFPPFSPEVIMENKKVISTIFPAKLLDMVENDKDWEKKVSKRGKEIVSKLDYEDNPIVVIATLRE